MQSNYVWLLGIIDSVKKPFQIECCRNLIALFRQKYTLDDDFGPYYDELLKRIEAKNALLTT